MDSKSINLFFSGQVVEWEEEPPVEVALAGQGPIVDVGLLGIVRTFEPPVQKNKDQFKLFGDYLTWAIWKDTPWIVSALYRFLNFWPVS